MTTGAYDLIVVTGCSLSCGMEFNDRLLPPFATSEQRRASIWKWYKDTHHSGSMRIDELNYVAIAKWQDKEREQSWPALLERLSGIPVVNLSVIGASVGESLIHYTNFLKRDYKKRILAVHQLPGVGRMFMRFDKGSRIQMLPDNHELGYDKKYFADSIRNVKEQYKSRLLKDGYVEKHFRKVVLKLHKLSRERGINDYYIGNGVKGIEVPSRKFLIDDLQASLKDYKRGQLGHPVDPSYNKYICGKILTIL